jgi:hypothetical protein
MPCVQNSFGGWQLKLKYAVLHGVVEGFLDRRVVGLPVD